MSYSLHDFLQYGHGTTADCFIKLDVTGKLPAVDGSQLTNLPSGASLSTIYPVGSIYMSVVSTSPTVLFGMGVWTPFAEGKMLVGLNILDTDFDTAEETGGAKTKTIAQANLPNISTGAGTAHTHTQDSHNHTQDAHNHVITELRDATTGGSTTNIALSADTSSTTGTKVTGSKTATNQAATATNQNESAHTHSLGGSGTALNVVNPYIVVYMWKRTA